VEWGKRKEGVISRLNELIFFFLSFLSFSAVTHLIWR